MEILRLGIEHQHADQSLSLKDSLLKETSEHIHSIGFTHTKQTSTADQKIIYILNPSICLDYIAQLEWKTARD